MTQLENARKGIVTPQMERVARDESMEVERLVERVAGGRVVIPVNINHRNIDPVGIGQGLKTKTNANIGTSGDFPRLEDELKKLDMVVACGADTVMDLSTGGDLTRIRRALIGRSRIPFGNVPVYQMAVEAVDEKTTFVERTIDNMLECVRLQAEDGVDFMTIHAGLTQRAIEKLRKMPRRAGIVSRGGSLLTAWMIHRGEENPFYEHFDRLLDLARKYDITLSLGDGLRPGSLADATDWAQLEELMTLGELVKRSREAGVQVMVEGPGHLPLQQIEFNVQLEKQICDGAPFYVLGPLVTDIAPGYDHLTSAIGGAIAGAAGADFLCYVTPCEHLGLPDERDVRTGIYAARIAAHAADIAKGIPGALDRDRRMADARRRLAWDEQAEASIDPETFREIRGKRASSSDACSMCGDLCVYKIMEDFYR